MAVSRALRVDTLLRSLGFQMGEERRDQRGVDVADVEPGGRFAGAIVGEDQQQPQRVAIGGDGVRAGVALNRQPLGEERLDGGCQRGHDRCPLGCSSHCAATASSFGRGLRVPIRRCGADVTEVGRQQRHPRGDVCSVAAHLRHHAPDGRYALYAGVPLARAQRIYIDAEHLQRLDSGGGRRRS